MKHELPSELDWKKFRAIVPELRERYLRERNSELIAILRDESATSTNQFWSVSERITEIGKVLRMCLDGHSRSKMVYYLILMYGHQMLTEEDLEGFSEDVRGRLRGYTDLQNEEAQQVVDATARSSIVESTSTAPQHHL